MALQLSYTAPFLVAFAKAYWRVAIVALYPERGFAEIEVWIYPSAEIRRQDAQATVQRQLFPVYNTEERKTFSEFFSDVALSPEGMTPRKAAYLYLITLGGFAGAVDC